MKFLTIIFSLTLLWGDAISEDCDTPLGRTSDCVSLFDCPELFAVFNARPLSTYAVNFLRESQCGFDGYRPRVCCGPMPAEPSTARPPQPTRPSRPIRPNRPSNGVDPVADEDSYPASLDTCGVDTTGDRLYGGIITELDEFPWMALLGYRPRNGGSLSYQCGGVLVNHRYILTAAHCVIGEIETAVGKLESVRLGEYDTQSDIDCLSDTCADPVQEIPVHSAYPNRGYSDRNVNRQDDIALVRLSRRAQYSYYVQPICLANNNLRLEVGTDVYVAGWGKTENGTSSPVKLKLRMPVFQKSECDSKYRSLGADLTNKQICAGGVFAKDACRGDSGGPLMRKSAAGTWETVAIVSFGYGCGRDGWPGVYTSVASYTNWIKDTMRSTNV